MPILYNFHILLATFYTIFGTNILIQCPVPVPVCCMFIVSQKIHIKQSPNAIKTYRDFFGIYVIFGKKNQCETMPEGAPRQGARPRGSGAPWALVASLAWEGREPLRDWTCLSVSLCFCVPRFYPFTVSYIPGDP